ncbi:response regulator [Paenibacillus sp. JSM ZJ436]|uniref:response regulator n=1 Tax=Paenibacillus sp. JSM ZJ436 TaxID=3376190 RepID=UPI0037A9D88A
MLRVALLDDERPALNVLSGLIRSMKGVELTGAFTNPAELLQQLQECRPHLVLLDIEMPGMNGLELAAALLDMEEEIEVIFVSAYHQYALEAFRVQAVDYLLKPVDPVLLQGSVDRVIRRKLGSRPAVVEDQEGASIACLGGLELHKAGQPEPVRFPTAKAEELFAYLLVHRNTDVSKWTLGDLLWPDIVSTEKVNHNLHMAVYRMKKSLKDHGLAVRISSQRGFYRLECDDPCDYIALEEAGQAPQVNRENVKALTEAVKLYKGPLFAGRDYPWCEGERERMSRCYRALSRKLAAWQTGQHRYHEAVELLLPLLEEAPLDEEGHEVLLRAYDGLQQRTSFIAHYEKIKRSFREELGEEPPQGLRKLYSDLR